MLVLARRPTASLCIALLALNTVACTHITQVEAPGIVQPSGGSVPAKKLVGVTLKDGREIRFDKNSRPVVRGDSLQAQVGKRPLAIPVSDVQRAWVQSVDKTTTTFLVIGVAVVLLAIAAAAAASAIGDSLQGI
jgi:hypothetical protein